MITPMKKVTVLCLSSAKAETLEVLRTMGIMHLTPLQAPAGATLNAARSEMSRVQKAIEVIPDKVPKGTAQTAPAESGDALVGEIQKLISARKESEDSIAQAEASLARYEVFGNLDPESVAALEKSGVYVRLYESEHGKPFSVDGDGLLFPFGSNAGGDCYAVVNCGTEPVKVKGNYANLPLPPHSIAAIRKTKNDAHAELVNVEKRLAELSSQKKVLRNRLKDAADVCSFEEAAAGMLSSTTVSAVKGFCPAPRVDELQRAAKQYGWGIQVEDPADDDDVPTLLAFKPAIAPMKFLYDIIGISPGYREVDVSSVFLCFFSLFFAMIVGDAVYGFLFLAVTLYARKKMPEASSAGFHFMELMSGATIFWGIINASYLGLKPDVAHWTYYLDLTNYAWTPVWIKTAMLWIRDSLHVQQFCFCIGVVHLSIAHIWNIKVKIQQKSTVALAQLGWLCTTWCMFFLANYMVLQIAMPKIMLPLFITGVTLLVLFSVPPSKLKEEWISIPMLALNLVSNFVDVISYIRLFAVGMSGAAIAEAFNGMLSPLFGSVFGLLAAALVLLFVHALNVALGIMGVAVHAVRLNTLEFSNGLDLQWSGFPFSPFSRHKH